MKKDLFFLLMLRVFKMWQKIKKKSANQKKEKVTIYGKKNPSESEYLLAEVGEVSECALAII